MSIKIESDS